MRALLKILENLRILRIGRQSEIYIYKEMLSFLWHTSTIVFQWDEVYNRSMKRQCEMRYFNTNRSSITRRKTFVQYTALQNTYMCLLDSAILIYCTHKYFSIHELVHRFFRSDQERNCYSNYAIKRWKIIKSLKSNLLSKNWTSKLIPRRKIPYAGRTCIVFFR